MYLLIYDIFNPFEEIDETYIMEFETEASLIEKVNDLKDYYRTIITIKKAVEIARKIEL